MHLFCLFFYFEVIIRHIGICKISRAPHTLHPASPNVDILYNCNTISWTWNWDLYDTTGAEAPVFCHLMQTDYSLKKSLMLGKIEVRRGRGYQRMRRLDGMNVGKLWEMVRDRETWHAAVLGVAKSQTRLGNWTTITKVGFRNVEIISDLDNNSMCEWWGQSLLGEGWENG